LRVIEYLPWDGNLLGYDHLPEWDYLLWSSDLLYRRHVRFRANLRTVQHVRRRADVCGCRVMQWNHDMRNPRGDVYGISHVSRFAVLHRYNDVCHQHHLSSDLADVRGGGRNMRRTTHVQ
jgi:hypothetical protein